MAAEQATGAEENLADSELVLNSMLERIDTYSLLFTWTIKNYSKLRKNVFYWTVYLRTKRSIGVKYRWKFQLIKAGGTLFTLLSSNSGNKLVYFSLVSNNKQMRGGNTVEITHGLYVCEFCRKAIEDGNFLVNDQLAIQCRYKKKAIDGRVMLLPYGQPRDSVDVFQVCDDFRELYLQGKLADYTIITSNKSFPVHKAILVTRSQYFAEAFEFDGDISREQFTTASPIAMHNVLLYLYSGEFKKMDFYAMMDIYCIAERMKIQCLICKCMNFFEKNFTPDNVGDVIDRAMANDLVSLKNAAVRYIIRTFGEVLTSDELSRIIGL